MNRLSGKEKFCKIDDWFVVDPSSFNIEYDENKISLFQCHRVYKSYTTRYRFNFYTWDIVDSRLSRYGGITFIRPHLNKFYKENKIQEISPMLLAKIKLMEGN